MADLNLEDGQSVPQHLQQQQQLAALLEQDRQLSDSVTWVPELIPTFVQRAVQTVLERPADVDGTSTLDDSSASPTISAPTAPAAALVAVGSQHLQVTSSSKRPQQWVMTTCLVPEGLPTAAAAEHAGGLATMEVVCRLVTLTECQAAEASAAFLKALKKVKWQQYGLQFRDFFSCDDTTGVLTLGVLPDAVMVPLSLFVCCCNVIEPPQDAQDADDSPSAADQDPADPTQAQTQQPNAAPPSSKRRRGGNRAPPKPPSLSLRREVPLWTAAVEAALSSLKAQLPAGYMRGRHETLIASALPPIAASLANIMLRAANTQFKQDSCSLLDCEPADLQDTLLEQLKVLAAEALANKAAGPTQQPARQTQQPVDVSAAAAALLDARWQEETAEGSQGRQQDQQTEPAAQLQHQLEQQQQAGQQVLPNQQQQQQQWPPPAASIQDSGLHGFTAYPLTAPGVGFGGMLPAYRSSMQQLDPGLGTPWNQEQQQQGLHGRVWQQQRQQHAPAEDWHQQQHDDQQPVAFGEQPLQSWQQQGLQQQQQGGCQPGAFRQQVSEEGQPVQPQQQQWPISGAGRQGGWGLLGPASTEVVQWYGSDAGATPSMLAPGSAQHATLPPAAVGTYGVGGSGNSYAIVASGGHGIGGFPAPAGLVGRSGTVAGMVGAGAARAAVPASRRRVSGSAAANLF